MAASPSLVREYDPVAVEVVALFQKHMLPEAVLLCHHKGCHGRLVVALEQRPGLPPPPATRPSL